MLQIVPLPVQLMLVAPSPKYSTMALVPPLTVSMPATFRITSFGEAQPFSFPVSLTPMSLLAQRSLLNYKSRQILPAIFGNET
jgi:hypothetical protein